MLNNFRFRWNHLEKIVLRKWHQYIPNLFKPCNEDEQHQQETGNSDYCPEYPTRSRIEYELVAKSVNLSVFGYSEMLFQ